MVKTYTIAYDECLFACVPDGADLEAELQRVEAEAGITIDRGSLSIESGLHLVDADKEGDDVVWSGNALGWLSDETGRSFEYAVRRA